MRIVAKPHNNGQWTEARKRQFVISALRGARWPPKYAAIDKAFVEFGANPKTGRRCKLHRCAKCRELFPKNRMQADHIVPVIGPEGFQNWDTYIERLLVEENGFQALCRPCHDVLTYSERYGCSEEEAAIRKELIWFGKLKSGEQKKLLDELGLPSGGTRADRAGVYQRHVSP